MKRVIEGRLYNTETAQEICGVGGTPGVSSNDFHYWSATLYRTKKKAFFLAGHGGAMTMFAEPNGSNGFTGSSGIILLSEDDAARYAERVLSTESYTEIFGVEEA